MIYLYDVRSGSSIVHFAQPGRGLVILCFLQYCCNDKKYI